MPPAVCEQPDCGLWAYTAVAWGEDLKSNQSYTPGRLANIAHWTCLGCFEKWMDMEQGHECPWCEKKCNTVSKWRYRNGFYTYEGEVWTTVL